MKSVTDVLQRTPWWALIFAALATFVALAVFVIPYHILHYREDAKTTDESRAIQREIDNTFAENAISVGRNVVKGMLARTKDPERRAELEEALAGLEEAREELKQAGNDAQRARKEALANLKEAQRATLEAVRKARRETEAALKEVEPEDKALRKQLEESLKSAQKAEREAEQALSETKSKRNIVIGGRGKPSVDIQIEMNDDAAKAVPVPPMPGHTAPMPVPPSAEIPAPPAVGATPPAPPPIDPETATRIRRDVTGDMYRMAIGAGLIFILLPLFILAVVTKFFADRSRASQKVAEAKRKEADFARMEQQVTEAKLSALQAQVEPHFLYNTLASVQALTEVDPAKANEMTGHLIQYLRNALPKMRESVSTVGQEVELVRAYLSILQMRMGQRLSFEIDVPEALKAMPFPPLMLPSLVENSIKHGLEPQREGGMVKITASAEDGRLRMIVTDTGRGFGETVGAGVGLANIRERLAALYGDNAKFTLEANEPRGVVATIEVPAEGTRAAAAAAATAATLETPAPRPAPEPVKVVRSGFWPQTWDTLMVIERLWRKTLYWLYLGLLVVAGAIAVGAFVGVVVGAIPVVMGSDTVSRPLAILIALAGALIGFIAVAAALAIVMLVFYALGWVMLAVVLIVALSLAIGLSPLFAPFVLVGFLIWWFGKRKKKQQEPAAQPARVEPTMHSPPPDEPPPVAPAPPAPEPGR